MTYKIHSTGLPAHLSRHINRRETTQTLRSSNTLLLTVPFTRTELAKRAFRCAAPSVWNSLPSFIINSGSLTTFKSRLKTYFSGYLSIVAYTSYLSSPHHIPASASEVTTSWRYINQFIIIIIMTGKTKWNIINIIWPVSRYSAAKYLIIMKLCCYVPYDVSQSTSALSAACRRYRPL